MFPHTVNMLTQFCGQLNNGKNYDSTSWREQAGVSCLVGKQRRFVPQSKDIRVGQESDQLFLGQYSNGTASPLSRQ